MIVDNPAVVPKKLWRASINQSEKKPTYKKHRIFSIKMILDNYQAKMRRAIELKIQS